VNRTTVTAVLNRNRELFFSSIEEGQQLAHTNMYTLCQATPTYTRRPAAGILL